MTLECTQPTPMILTLHVHDTRVPDLVRADHLTFDPPVPVTDYRDGFGNRCSRIVAPPGALRISADAVVDDSGRADVIADHAKQLPVPDLPEETLVFLLGSRYCDTDLLSQTAWDLFGDGPTGWALVQSICDYVHDHITFDYQCASSTRTARGAFDERVGVCRDYAHLAIAFCRAMNVPARYCNGYLADIGTASSDPRDFHAWLEAFLGGQWYVFDPRNKTPRIGRVLIARGRDAADVAMVNSFGSILLTEFVVRSEEVAEAAG
ncbi:transglutaminase domain-containing protein [Skermania piniformis]|uniref:Transglutaminase family protein n=1 Tax=Skermania pinensis TaxID=39122 RepID=A0ABX8SAL8_9ACTN|nr:transglutaminase family protein [Skermania piniformis]QXQ14217.1 transglutaminase family protein [Skermania piniformis]